MDDPSSDILIKAASQVITDILKDTVIGIKGWVTHTKKEIDPLGLAAKKYSNHLVEYLNVIRVIGMDSPINLENQYVDIFLYDKTTQNLALSYEEAKRSYCIDERKFETSRKKVSVTDVVNNFNKIMILGRPGSGKTTFLKHLAFLNLKESTLINKKRIPIFILLREFSEKSFNLEEYIIYQFNLHLSQDSNQLIKKLLENGRCQILLDGLDEIKTATKNKVIQEIDEFATKFSTNQIVINSRIGDYEDWFEKFVNLEIAEFDDAQIKLFINQWFPHREQKEDFLLKLFANPSIKDLATCPLLLALICLTYSVKQEFPRNRSKLYDEAIKILVKKWDISKNIVRNNIHEKLTNSDLLEVLSKIGLDTFSRNEMFFPKITLASYIGKEINNLPKFKDNNIDLDLENIINSIEVNNGLFAKRSNSVYSFSHLTFQEYFCARCIANNHKDASLNSMLDEYLFSSKWREIISIISGLLPIGDGLVIYLRNKLLSLPQKEPKLERLLKLSTSINQIENSNVLEKGIALYLTISIIHINTGSYSNGLSESINFIKNIELRHNYNIPDNYTNLNSLNFKRSLDKYENIITIVRSELNLVRDVTHRLLYPYKFEILLDQIEDFQKYRYLFDHEFETLLVNYLHIAGIYYDCLASSPYLTVKTPMELKNEIFN